MVDRQRNDLGGRICQTVVQLFIRDSSFITTFNVDNIRMNVGLQKKTVIIFHAVATYLSF